MSLRDQNSLEDMLFWLGLIVLAAGAVLLGGYACGVLPDISGAGCFWEQKFGFYCPGCGGTRAVKALISGHPIVSLWYHPLVLYSVVIFSAFMLSQAFARLSRFRFGRGLRFHNWYLYTALGILIGNWVLRNVLRMVCRITL